jgi:hypothetical protein
MQLLAVERGKEALHVSREGSKRGMRGGWGVWGNAACLPCGKAACLPRHMQRCLPTLVPSPPRHANIKRLRLGLGLGFRPTHLGLTPRRDWGPT